MTVILGPANPTRLGPYVNNGTDFNQCRYAAMQSAGSLHDQKKLAHCASILVDWPITESGSGKHCEGVTIVVVVMDGRSSAWELLNKLEEPG